MREFTLDPKYFTDVTIRKEWNMYTKDGREPTPEELLLILQGKGKCSITGSEDHPEFAKLRKQLGELGYIHIENGWVNGDRVLKPFKLNGLILEEGDKFSCAAAFGTRWTVIQKYPEHRKEGYW